MRQFIGGMNTIKMIHRSFFDPGFLHDRCKRFFYQRNSRSTSERFKWGVWVSLSETNFMRYREIFGTEQELSEKPYFGWLSSKLSGYPDTSESVKTDVYLQGGGMRPKIVLDHSNPFLLCQEQHNGISLHRIREILKANGVDTDFGLRKFGFGIPRLILVILFSIVIFLLYILLVAGIGQLMRIF